MKKSLLIMAALLSLSAINANAAVIPAPISGDPYTLIQPNSTWVNVGTPAGVGTSTGVVEVNRTIAAYQFDVTTAGSLDVFTNVHGVISADPDLFIFKKDAGGTDWTLAFYSQDGDRISATNPINLFGVPIMGYVPGQPLSGLSDAGVRRNFDIGTYVALVTTTEASMTNYQVGNDGEGIAKLTEGFTWFEELMVGEALLHDITIKSSPGSLAVVAPVPVPAAIWLMGSALAGLSVVGRKKAQTLAA